MPRDIVTIRQRSGLIFPSVVASYLGPGDLTFASATVQFWGGFRAYSAAKAAAQVALFDITDAAAGTNNATVHCLTTGYIDETAGGTLGAFITAHGAARVTRLYDQSGAGNDAFSNIANSGVGVTQNVAGTHSALDWTASSSRNFITTTTFTRTPSSTSPFVLSSFYKDKQTGQCLNSFVSTDLILGEAQSAVLGAFIYANSTTVNTPTVPALNSWNSLIGVFNGTTSTVNLNGTSTSASIGTSGPSAQAYQIGLYGFGSTYYDGASLEHGFWNGTMSTPEMAALSSQSHGAWGV